jgi:glycosyltransferase involved in cell wall biosynthesis
MNYPPKAKVAIITTIDDSLSGLFPGFYPLLVERGYDVVGICADTSNGNRSDRVRQQGVRVINIPMTRVFSVFQDIRCVGLLWNIFRKEKFDIIHYSTPKAAFLSALAGKFISSSYKLYTLRGLGYSAYTGKKRQIGRFCEKVACKNADMVIAISPSLAAEAVQEGLLPQDKIRVLGAGSSKGVDLEQFRLTEQRKQQGQDLRRSLGINPEDIVIGYAGRFTPEKGLIELYEAFKQIEKQEKKVRMIWVGCQDQRHPLPDSLFQEIKQNSKIHLLPRTDDLPSHLAAFDIFVLASHREGFGNVVIEASAMQLPVLASDIPGCRDAVLPGETGFLVYPQNADSLREGLMKLIRDSNLRSKLGTNGCDWVRKTFDRKKIWDDLLTVYDSIIRGKSKS